MESWLSSRTKPTRLRPPLSISGMCFLKVEDLPFQAAPVRTRTAGRFMVSTLCNGSTSYMALESFFVVMQPVEEDRIIEKFIDIESANHAYSFLTVISCATGIMTCPF